MARLVIAASRIWVKPGVVLDDAEVVCEDGVVLRVGQAAPADDADRLEVDGFVMPAAADRHVHIGLSDPWPVLAGGVTAVRDLGWPANLIFPLAELSDGPAFEGPLIRAAGPMLTAPGGYPTQASWAPEGTAVEVATPADGAAAVHRLAGLGAAAIKVALNAEVGPTPDDATLVAIVDAADALGVPVTAHAQGSGQVERALGAGIHELAHTPWIQLGDDLIEQAARRIRIVSTLDMTSFGRDTPNLRAAIDNLRRFLAAGGDVVYGTDLGNGSIPPGIHVRELTLLRESGLDPDGVLAALTRAPLEPGAPADLIALAADPLEDFGAFERIAAVIRAGRRII
ncbi:MAG: amidohydrolase [Actinomycetota bacterium]